jgi:hypothetical protein
MQLSSVLLALAATASSLGFAPRQYSTCPPIWTTVASDLKGVFSGCGREAHGAIRAPFHDCINNGCDGSLITQGECDRSENAGLADTCKLLLSWTNKYNVSAADMIQFAAATAIAVCPLGPRVQALVGRRDGTKPAPEGQVPGSRDPVPKILGAFAEKGFSPEDVVALLGTHSVAVQVFDDPSQAGKSLDTTPSVYDTKFYQETIDGTVGPRVQALVGRRDGTQPAPEGQVPGSRDPVPKILGAFAEKGFSPEDLVALLGTHSVAVQVSDDPSQAGKSLDTTPSVYDTKFYQETIDGTAPYTLQSDKKLSKSEVTSHTWSNFASSTDEWSSAFVSAWDRFAVIGNDVGSLVDCTSVIPASSDKVRRNMGMNGRYAARAYAKYHH